MIGGRDAAVRVGACAALMLMCAWMFGATAAFPQAGYFFLPTPPLGFTLMSVPSDAAPGTIRRALPLGAAPDLHAAGGRGLVMIYRPQGEATRGQCAWLARRVDPGTPLDAPSADPLPPLKIEGTPIDLAVTSRGVLALIVRENVRELKELRGGSWVVVSPPSGFDPALPAQLLSGADEALLFQNHRDDSATLWRRSEPEGAWSASRFPAVRDAELHVVADQIVGVRTESPTSSSLLLVRPTTVSTVASLAGLAADHWIIVGTRSICVVESDGALLPRLSCRVLSASGSVLYQGPAIIASPIGRRDLALLVLALVSLFSAVLVFVFRPEASRRQSVVMPARTALAGPATRTLAGIIDVMIAWGIAGLSRGALMADLGASLLPTGEDASATLLVALPIAVGLGSVMEYWLGRSFGKLMTGCRVVSASGGRLTLGQAAARNLVRFLCPPLGMSWMLQGPEQGAGLFGTMVVIDLNEPPDASDSPGG